MRVTTHVKAPWVGSLRAHQLEEGVDGVLGARVLAVVRDQVLRCVDAVHVLLVVQQACVHSASYAYQPGGNTTSMF